MAVALIGTAACQQKEPVGAQPGNDAAPVAEVPSNPTEAQNEVRVAGQAENSSKPVLSEPKGPIDSKSVEAAGQVVQSYGALIEQGRWASSRALWSDVDAAKAFERNFRNYADVHLEIGKLGEPEGAAGSIYLSEAVVFYGKKNGGGHYRRSAEVVLRRVNDVPGSTEEQRHWHIERIEWKG